MFTSATSLGTLDVQLVYFRGIDGYGGECKASRWTGDPQDLARAMARISCQNGHTQIRRALEHVAKSLLAIACNNACMHH
jgi:hypothetical protein